MAKHKLQIEAEYKDKGATQGVNKFSGSLGGLNAVAGPVGIAVGAIGAALIGVGVEALNTSREIDNATSNMQAQLGLTDQKAAEFEDTMKSIYAAGYGESFDEIGDALATTNQQFERLNTELSQAELERVTTDALAMAEVFDTDVAESTSAAVTLMENFGLTSQEAMDLLAAGMQGGLNSSDDLLDTIGEYSGQFSDMGLNAEQFFSILESGNAGGVLGTDKVADAFKEFNLLFVEGTDAQREAYDALGLDYDELVAGVQSGSMTVGDAALMVAERLGEIEDPIERDRLAYELFGTQAEDLTSDVIAGLDDMTISLEGAEGAVDSVREANEDLDDQWQQAMREMQLALQPIGDLLTEIGLAIIPLVIKAVEWLADSLEWVVEKVKEVYQWFVDLWESATKFYEDTMAFLGFGGSSGVPGFATGTTSAPGGPALVGEQGPEMVYLPQGAQVTNAAQTRQAMTVDGGMGGGYTFNITINGNATAADVESGVLSAMRMAGA